MMPKRKPFDWDEAERTFVATGCSRGKQQHPTREGAQGQLVALRRREQGRPSLSTGRRRPVQPPEVRGIRRHSEAAEVYLCDGPDGCGMWHIGTRRSGGRPTT